ncbi:MAG: hypothetical protein KatS3mg055_1242 [Chloroflexus sp.]|nr:MAG: hypothetical protein KatS3mg055_1242 [Chloroflexus sp.]
MGQGVEAPRALREGTACRTPTALRGYTACRTPTDGVLCVNLFAPLRPLRLCVSPSWVHGVPYPYSPSRGHGGAVPLQPFVGTRRAVPRRMAFCALTASRLCALCAFALTASRLCVLCAFALTASRLCALCAFALTASRLCALCAFALTALLPLRSLREPLCVRVVRFPTPLPTATRPTPSPPRRPNTRNRATYRPDNPYRPANQNGHGHTD